LLRIVWEGFKGVRPINATVRAEADAKLPVKGLSFDKNP